MEVQWQMRGRLGASSITQKERFAVVPSITEPVTAGWGFIVERGPDWLIIKLQPGKGSYYDSPEIADRIWQILDKHFIYRLVLEMDEVDVLPSHLMGQLVMLQKRVLQHDGALRLCHLRPACADVLRLTRLESVLKNYATREEAVLGCSPQKPR